MVDYKSMWESAYDENKFLRHNIERMRGTKTENPTLRDQFAMAALPAMMSHVGWEHWAEYSYEVADMMMEAREKK